MANSLDQFGISDDELQAAIAADAEVNASVNATMAEIVKVWRGNTPVDAGAAAASVKIVKKARSGKGRVGMTNYKAHWIEFGTGQPGPTPVFAPGQKTATQFGGTLSEGVEVGGGDDE